MVDATLAESIVTLVWQGELIKNGLF